MILMRKTGVILALDITGKEIAIELTKSVSNHIDAVKIGYPLVLSTDMVIIEKLKSVCRLPLKPKS